MSDEDIALDEKRVFEGRREVSLAYVASGLGLARVEISDDQIGRFGLVERADCRDVATNSHEGTVALAADEDVMLGADEAFEATGFGPAVAVAFCDGPIAAAPDGRIARRQGNEWTTVGTVDAEVRAMDGDLLGTADGAYRIVDGGLVDCGLDAVRDVAAGGPFAATPTGLHRFRDGDWKRTFEGNTSAVAGTDERVLAVVDGEVVEGTDGDWRSADCPSQGVADVAVERAGYAVTQGGTLLVDPPTAKDGAAGWATRSLGLTDVAGLAVLEASE